MEAMHPSPEELQKFGVKRVGETDQPESLSERNRAGRWLAKASSAGSAAKAGAAGRKRLIDGICRQECGPFGSGKVLRGKPGGKPGTD